MKLAEKFENILDNFNEQDSVDKGPEDKSFAAGINDRGPEIQSINKTGSAPVAPAPVEAPADEPMEEPSEEEAFEETFGYSLDDINSAMDEMEDEEVEVEIEDEEMEDEPKPEAPVEEAPKMDSKPDAKAGDFHDYDDFSFPPHSSGSSSMGDE